MSRTLTLELNDKIYSKIQRQAEEAGVSPVDWALRALERYRAPREVHPPRRSAWAEEQKKNYARELADLDAAYADDPTPEEQETQRRLWEIQKKQMAQEPW
jgi:hypothetical protein